MHATISSAKCTYAFEIYFHSIEIKMAHYMATLKHSPKDYILYTSIKWTCYLYTTLLELIKRLSYKVFAIRAIWI